MTNSSPGRALQHRHTRPLSALPGRKRDHPDDDKTDVGVDAVLSADVGDAPMRLRPRYSAPVYAPAAPTSNVIRETLAGESRERTISQAIAVKNHIGV
jgi:hypothetical protein